MKTSVVMSTYNGEKYIVEQMESLRQQTHPADEVLIFDDCSKDRTVEIVNDFIKNNNLSGWKIEVNAHNKGFRLNFLDGISKASGDILYYCDQDDIWDLRKIELMNNIFENLNVQVCACTVIRFDDDKKENFGLVNNLYKGNGKLIQYDFFKKMKHPSGYGHTLAFRKEFIDIAIPIIMEYNLLFDEGLAIISSISHQFYMLGVPLVFHRVHSANGGGNASSPHYTVKSRIKDIQRQIDSRKLKIKQIQFYRDYYAESFSEKELKIIDDFLKFIKKRIGYLEDRKLCKCIFQTFHHNKLNDFSYLITDNLCILFNKKKSMDK